MNNNFYILYGVKEGEVYYISNTNPVIWNSDIRQSKLYYTEYSAEYNILRDYDTYKYISKMISENKISSIYVAIIDQEYNEKGRVKLL